MDVNAAIRLKHQGHIRNVLSVKAGPVDLGKVPPLWGVFNVFDATRDFAAACEQVRSALGLPAVPKAPKRPARTASIGSSPAAAKQPTESADDLMARGKALVAQSKFAEALPLFQRATEVNPNLAEAWAFLSRAHSAKGHPEEGLETSEHAIQFNHDSVVGWFARGNAMSALGRHEEALAAYDRATVLDPNFAIA
jgi:tetratricopeptide (TPR) repeat protein